MTNAEYVQGFVSLLSETISNPNAASSVVILLAQRLTLK